MAEVGAKALAVVGDPDVRVVIFCAGEEDIAVVVVLDESQGPHCEITGAVRTIRLACINFLEKTIWEVRVLATYLVMDLIMAVKLVLGLAC